MKRKFTDEDILRFLFEEMEQKESENFLTVLCADEALWERYEYFQEVVEKSSSLSFEPSDESCQNIMNFVEATNPHAEIPSEKNPYLAGLRNTRLSTNTILMFVLALFGSITIIGSVYQMQKFEEQNKRVEQRIDRLERLNWEDPVLESKMDKVQLELERLKNEDTQEL